MKRFDLAILDTPEGRLRLLSGAVLAPVALGVVCLGGAAFAGLILLVMAAGLYEWLRLVDAGAPGIDRCGMFAVLALSLVLAAAGFCVVGLAAVAMGTVVFYVRRGAADPSRARLFALGLPYMAVSGIALLYLRATPFCGLAMCMYLLAVVWGMDSGGYVAGKLIGGAKLAPAISPGKTWSGFFGGVVLAIVLSTLVLLIAGARSVGAGLFLAAILAAVAQGGDLFKSFFKRRAGVKDSGSLIPGHGGVLDRIDGLVFAAMVLAVLQTVCGGRILW